VHRRLLRLGLAGLAIAAATLGAALFAGVVDVAGARWPVKTFRDPDRGRVRWAPVDTTIAALGRIPRPPDSAISGRSRVPPHELTVYRVHARLRRVVGSGDGDLHLLLADPANPSRTMIAEVPHPWLALGSGLESVFRSERALLRAHRPSRGENVVVTGVGFFDRPARGGSRSNELELHPVIGLAFEKSGPIR